MTRLSVLLSFTFTIAASAFAHTYTLDRITPQYLPNNGNGVQTKIAFENSYLRGTGSLVFDSTLVSGSTVSFKGQTFSDYLVMMDFVRNTYCDNAYAPKKDKATVSFRATAADSQQSTLVDLRGVALETDAPMVTRVSVHFHDDGDAHVNGGDGEDYLVSCNNNSAR